MKINVKDTKFDALRGLSTEQRATKLAEHLAFVEPLTTRAEGINAEESERLATALDEIEFLGHLKEQTQRMMDLAGTPGHTESGTTFTAPKRDTDPIRSAALRNVERSHKAGRLSEASAALSEKLVRGDTVTARLAATTGTDEYRSAFAKLVADPEQAHLLWTPSEGQAFRDAASIRGLIEGSGGTGKYLVPFDLDPTILIANAGSASPLREISRVVKTNSSAWNGVSSAGVTSTWTAEAVEATDGTPTLAPEPIPVHKLTTWVPFSIELEEDGLGLLSELQKLILDSAIEAENAAFATGSGSGQPTGLITALVAATTPIVLAGGEALAAADVYALQNALGPRYQANASFAANLAILNTIRQFETTNGALKFPSAQDFPARLLGRPLHEVSGMDGSINAAATAANYVAVYGDFQNFVIADKVGTTIDLVQHVFGSNGRPTGERGLYMHHRVGSDVVNPAAFKLLNVATTA